MLLIISYPTPKVNQRMKEAYAGVVWDSEDYILELSGDLTKKELIDLAKTAKVFKD